MISPKTIKARNLRNNPTEAEKKLWAALRANKIGARFRRQYPIGVYVADFVCKEKNLVIEVDGGQHNIANDQIRTKYINEQGFHVLRFWNNDVLKNIEGVMIEIINYLNSPPPPPRLRGGERTGV